jgi:hypothetical protein
MCTDIDRISELVKEDTLLGEPREDRLKNPLR